MRQMPPSMPLSSLDGLGPVLLPDSHTLILCSYPGKVSFEKREYYADAQNGFWMLMSAVINVSLSDSPYEEKLKRLLSHGIGLWDVISACQGKGSLKAVLAENRADRFALLRRHYPLVQKICFNGQPAGEYAPLFEQAGYATLILPSSSPAWSKQPLEKKREIWRHIL